MPRGRGIHHHYLTGVGIMQTTIAIGRRTAVSPARARTGTNVSLWIVQTILAALFLFAGGYKLVLPTAALTQQMPLPGAFIKFIGVLEMAGALGLILPGILRRARHLVPLAAAGLVFVMCGAVGATLAMGGGTQALTPVLVGVLLVTVVYGRRASLSGDQQR